MALLSPLDIGRVHIWTIARDTHSRISAGNRFAAFWADEEPRYIPDVLAAGSVHGSVYRLEISGNSDNWIGRSGDAHPRSNSVPPPDQPDVLKVREV